MRSVCVSAALASDPMMQRRQALALIAVAASPFVPRATAAAAETAQVIFGGAVPKIGAPFRPKKAPPAIDAIWFSHPVYAWGDLLRVAVVTTTNVAVVEMRVGSYGRALTKKTFGQFDGVYRVPFMPPLLDRLHYTLPFHFIVRNPAGVAASFDVSVPIG